MQRTYKASKSRSQREGWCVLFRHPLRHDREGRPLRLRLGLGTRDEKEADRFVAQLNVLLGDETYWPLAARERAAREMHSRVVAIFYDGIEAKLADPATIREESIALPGRDEGYTKVLLLGPTGAGKTTLLRQIIGSDPDRERFPSTSTARTTIFDIEIVLAPPPYRAVVSFLPLDQVRFYIEECVVAAVSAAAEGSSDAVVLQRLLEHSEQRFRLNYVLGTLPERDAQLSDDALADDDASRTQEDVGRRGPSDEERKRMQSTLSGFVTRVFQLADLVGRRTADDLGVDPASLKPGDRDAFLDMLEHELRDRAEAQDLIDDILSEVKTRFDSVDEGCDRDRSGWATRWTLTTDDRSRFIRAVNWFSSNYAPEFGQLLTPLVQGLRVSGPFKPAWQEAAPRFVLMDGEGLGHSADSVSSLPTSLTKRYEQADAIVLVDNAVQPMLAGPQAVLRSLSASGNERKLAVVFTHFDQVKGDNLPTTDSKRHHVVAQLDSAVKALEGGLGTYAARSMRRALTDKIFFVASIQDVLPDRARFTRDQLTRLLKAFEDACRPAPAAAATPIYDVAHLILSVRTAADSFHENWNARLGLGYYPGVSSEHWTRVKALSRRFAYQWADQYDTLRPVADLIKLISERVNSFIAVPRNWDPAPPDEEGWTRAVGAVAREMYVRLHELATSRLFRDQLLQWAQAYQESSVGSARRRANQIRGIYEVAAPVPGEIPSPEATDFLDAVRRMFKEAAEASGARVL